MVVTVHLHTILQRETPAGPVRQLELEIAPGSTVAQLLQTLEIDLSWEALLVLVNGRLAELDLHLNGGDQVHLMPAISGGLRKSM